MYLHNRKKRAFRGTTRFNNCDEFYEGTEFFNPAMMNFIVIGEMADKFSDELKKETFDSIGWPKLVGFSKVL